MRNRLLSTFFVAAFGLSSAPLPAKEGPDEGPAAARAVARADGYKVGFAKGREDGVAGRSRTPGRWEGAYTKANRKEFFRGYEAGYNQGIRPGEQQARYGQPLTLVKRKFSVVVKEGRRTVSVCRTVSPNIEETRFIEEQNKLVIKSRGNHGPATVQLFDARSGRVLGKVMAYQIGQGGPAWAAGMGE